ncbi:hypothetical protein P886_0902 [Alteromonadaceae bacterium 2753L.S.0a.02]|nr:hypothetical protein P886_0902 [Alteromonadaceae bacterium 2753L.S.0a.02]
MKRLFISVVAVVFGASAGLASAADNRQNFNGGGCDNYYASDVSDFNHQTNGIRNVSSSSAYVHCDLTIDEAMNTGGTNFVWVRWAGTGTMSCTMMSRDVNGNLVSTVSNSGAPGWISIPAVSDNDIWGNYSMYCLLPANARLETISMSEVD